MEATSQAADFGLSAIGQIGVAMGQIDRAIAFYRDTRARHRARARNPRRARSDLRTGAPPVVARLPDHDLWLAFFRDPDRNLLALMSEVPRG